jgi:GST-like protein
MLDLYYWTTPNGHKVTIFLEETGLPYNVKPINIGRGEQFAPDFLKVAPNNRIPAIVDHAPADGGAAISIFESGAILLYLAEKTGRLLATDVRTRMDTVQWLFWQMAGLGPMAGQTHHFVHYAKEQIPYAVERYVNETGRLYAVMNRRLADREYLAGEYSIADIASYPWVQPERQNQNMRHFPHLERWKKAIASRPAVERAYALAKRINTKPANHDAESRRILFGQTRDVVK